MQPFGHSTNINGQVSQCLSFSLCCPVHEHLLFVQRTLIFFISALLQQYSGLNWRHQESHSRGDRFFFDSQYSPVNRPCKHYVHRTTKQVHSSILWGEKMAKWGVRIKYWNRRGEEGIEGRRPRLWPTQQPNNPIEVIKQTKSHKF